LLTISNPLGFWALLGIPAVLAIHFLQRQAREVPISTLFLLERTQKQDARGLKIERLLQSIPLWLQLLGVLLLTWLLVEPRIKQEKSTLRLAIVLDSSASMSVSKDAVSAKLGKQIEQLKQQVDSLEVTLLESIPGSQSLYRGNDPAALAKVLEAWQPRSGALDPAYSLRLARSLVSSEGVVIYVTDTPLAMAPYGALQLSAGRKIQNVGFTGINFEEKEGVLVFQALVKNYGDQQNTRTWQLETANHERTEPKSITLEPGAMLKIQAAFPSGAESATLRLSEDEFALDDVLPMVRPSPKPLNFFNLSKDTWGELGERLIKAIDHSQSTANLEQADISLMAYDPLNPMEIHGHGILFVHDDTASKGLLSGPLVTENHPLMEGLNWQSLLVSEGLSLELQAKDTLLLSQGKRPLIVLRNLHDPTTGKDQQRLMFNFDLNRSNAAKQAAFIVLVQRFAEEIRQQKVFRAVENLETSQTCSLRVDPRDASALTLNWENGSARERHSLEVSARGISNFQMPVNPGFVHIKQGEKELLMAGIHFADTREADFSACGEIDQAASAKESVKRQHTEPDPWWQGWLLLLLGAALASWHFVRRSDQREANVTTSTL
jgi:Aerotolerance regulator N-terminal